MRDINLTTVIFQPSSRPEQVWILTEEYITVVNNKLGISATIPYVAFNTELHKRGFYEDQRATTKKRTKK